MMKEERNERKDEKNRILLCNVFVPGFYVLSYGGISYECLCCDQMAGTDFKYYML